MKTKTRFVIQAYHDGLWSTVSALKTLNAAKKQIRALKADKNRVRVIQRTTIETEIRGVK